MALAAAVEGRTVNLHRQSLRAEPRGVKLIDQVDRRDEETMPAGLNDPARPAVDQIGHGAHPDQITPAARRRSSAARHKAPPGSNIAASPASRAPTR